MPVLDGTGPNGQGPRTGRGLGNCPGCGGVLPKLARRGFGLGLGRGMGFGRNRKNNVACCPLCPLCQQQQDAEMAKNEKLKEVDKEVIEK